MIRGFKCIVILTFMLLSSGMWPAQQCRAGVARPKRQWKYIVIHHSATPCGNLKIFDRYHRDMRRMTNGVAYHFVICNGTNGTKDGQIQTSKRWTKQLHGGHCHVDYNNQHGIGICLVGNFEKKRPTEKQFWSLVWLTKKMMAEQEIPRSNVLGHGKMPGEKTKCPGKHFPWKRFYRAIKG
jgi:N-acetylmuramoyl-L-alanine amidase